MSLERWGLRGRFVDEWGCVGIGAVTEGPCGECLRRRGLGAGEEEYLWDGLSAIRTVVVLPSY